MVANDADLGWPRFRVVRRTTLGFADVDDGDRMHQPDEMDASTRCSHTSVIMAIMIVLVISRQPDM